MAQVTQTIRNEVAADTTEQNVLVGTKLENVPTDAQAYRVTVLAAADSFDLLHKLEADTDVAVQESVIGATDRKPVDPDDFVGEFLVSGGTKLFLQLTNTDGANPHTATHTFFIEPVG